MHARRRLLLVLTIAVAGVAWPSAASAVPAASSAPARAAGADVSLRPIADATVTLRGPSPLVGRSSRLRIDAGARRAALLRFDLRQVTGPVGRAMLVLRVVRGGHGRIAAERAVVGQWRERRHRLGGRLRTTGEPVEANVARGTRRVTLDVTGLVRAGRRVTLAVLPVRGATLAVWSRQGPRDRVPVLVVTPGAPGQAPRPGSGTSPPGTTPAPGRPGSPGTPAGDSQPALPVRAAFYYPWYPETWTVGGQPVHYSPTLGRYSSTAVIPQHLDALEYAHVQVAISSWWGPGTPTDQRLPALLDATRSRGDPLRWALYYEHESVADPTVDELRSDLSYIATRYGRDPAFFRVGGRPVVFVFSVAGDACPMAQRWKAAASAVGVYVVLKIFSSYQTCPAQPDAWHQYAPAGSQHAVPGSSFAISPGFWKANEAAPRLARDLARWRQDVQAMVASRAPFQLVTTFNEWGEGTATESAAEWASPSGFGAYLDVLHSVG